MRITFNVIMFRLVIFSCLFLSTFASSAQQQKTQEKIVVDHDTAICKVPYQVSVQYNGKHLCGGSIIGTQYVLTAASCIHKKEATFLSIRAGSNYHYKDGQVVDVDEVINHQNYNSDSVDYDVAILVLKDPLNSNEKVKAVTFSSTEPKEGDMVLISGWGSLGEGKEAANFLQSVSVPVVSKKDCNEIYGYDSETKSLMFCAGHLKGGEDACKGDSGGPAVIDGKLVGILSWGEECDGNFPPIYSNIAKILSEEFN